MIIVLGSVVIREGGIDQALAISKEHVARSRNEQGCISHAVHIDVDNSNRLVFVEEWDNELALQQHFKVPESRAFVKELAGLVTEPPRMVVYEAHVVQP
ncbi:antibiotic biosynthesis monooxygenase [Aquincola sp. S2]|uniref:Antibiotic biosynthesis monooxygenase n=1 Tax=Pseudaquabacterium terrae TaxID=2732868 RepID=A0ABX2EV04_9BURK|nr:putative quinol monooxygenase [Aquabacterium terrae]NRF72496.1 antibiotic biosynthesis monooxygenase [Aquabacterium terrae]